MPFYEFVCPACGRRFEVRRSVQDLLDGKIACPDCGGAELRRVFGRTGGSGCGGKSGCSCGGDCAGCGGCGK